MKKTRIRRYGSAFVAAVTGSVMLLAAQAPAAVHASPSFLQTKMNELVQAGLPGAQVNDNGTKAASGVANIATNQPMASNMTFRVGSITKSFTATVVLKLVAEGRLSLNDTLAQRMPGLLPYGNQITVRMLLQHTSGIPEYWEAGPDPLVYPFINDPAMRQQTWTPQQIIDHISSYPLDFTPGDHASYSSTNYVILGMMVEQITGHTLKSEITNRIITPLSLTDTRFPITETTIAGPSTHGYTYLFDEEGSPIVDNMVDVTNYNPSILWAMGNMTSSTKDLSKFYKALIGGQLLPNWLTQQMKQTVPLQMEEWPEGIGMGLGIWSWDLPSGVRIYGHEGEVPGSNTWAFTNASGSRAIIMQQNLLYMSWDTYFNTIMPTYFSLWCSAN